MAQWEYCKSDLGAVPRKGSDVDVLNDLGNNGWELVTIGANNVAYLKRQVAALPPSPKSVRRTKPVAAEAD